MVAPKITVWAKMPGIRNSRYPTPGTLIALPNTYANSRMNMIGDSVVKTSSSGTRLILMRLRLATMAPSRSVLVEVIAAPS